MSEKGTLLQELLTELAQTSNGGERSGPEVPPYDDTTPLEPEKSKIDLLQEVLGIRSRIALVSGRIHPDLGQKIARLLGIDLAPFKLWEFANGETFAKRKGESLRGSDVFVVQPITWAERTKEDDKDTPLERNEIFTPNDAINELIIAVATLRANTTRRITAVIPYFGWGQSDKKDQPGIAILARTMADNIVRSGVDRVVLMDLHSDQVQGFFDPTKVGVDHLYSAWALVPRIRKYVEEEGLKNIAVASPDAGGVHRVEYIAKLFPGAVVAHGNKRRVQNGKAEILEVVGDVAGRDVIIWDDIINTGGTLVDFSKALKERRAGRIIAVGAHAGFNGQATKKIHHSPIEKVFVTDSMPMGNKRKFTDGGEEKETDKIETVSIARLLAEAISRIHTDRSVSDLFLTIKS